MTATPQPGDLLRRGDVLDMLALTGLLPDDAALDAIRALPASPEAAALAAVTEAAARFIETHRTLRAGIPDMEAAKRFALAQAAQSVQADDLEEKLAALASLRAAREGRKP